MRRIIVIFCTIALLSAFADYATAQLNYKWTVVPMDSTWNEIKDPAATNIIAKYQPLVAPLMEIIGYSVDEYDKAKPESGLSNFAVDIIRDAASKHCNCNVDIAMTNFGGIRTSLPKGAVRVYDIYSIFPFDNYIVIATFKGDKLKKMLEALAQSGRVEAFSNVEFIIDNRKLVKSNIGGLPINPDKMYKFATINFLLEGGDGVQMKNYMESVEETDILIRDAIVSYIKGMTAKSEKIELKEDGRVISKNWERR